MLKSSTMLGFGAIICFLLTHLTVGVWRYYNILEEEELFTINAAIYLEYEGSSFLEWQYPESCDVNNKSSPTAVMRCKSPGFQAVKPLVSGVSIREEERHLFISDLFFRFAWYAVIPAVRNASESDYQIVRIWIIDPNQADQAEINKTALAPSKHSRFLTEQFLISGEFPVIKFSSAAQKIQCYFTNEGFWEAHLLRKPDYRSFHIVGQSVSFHGLSVVSSKHTFYEASPRKPHSDREVSLRLPVGSPISVVWSTCTPYRALVLSDKGIFMTENAFLTYEEIKVEPGELLVPTVGYYTIFEATLLENGIVFRIEDALFWRDNIDGILRMNPMKLLSRGVKGLNFRTQCVDYYPVQDFELASVLAWKDHELYIGGKHLDWQNNSSYMAKVLTLPETSTILTASFGSNPAALGALVMNTHTGDSFQPSLLTFYETEGIWRTSSFLSKLKEQSVHQGPFQMLFLSSALESLLVWNKESVLFSFLNDSKWGYLQLNDSSSLSQAANGSQIHQVLIDHSQNIVVKMENNMLFFCKAGVNRLVRLHTWTDTKSSIVLYLNQKEEITLLTVTDRGLHVQKYPLLMEIRSATRGGSHECPFIAFTHSMNKTVYYLDKGDRVELWAQIVYHEDKRVNVKLCRNMEHLLNITERSHFQSVRHVDAVNKTFIIYQDADCRLITNHSDGMFSCPIIGNSSQTLGIVSVELLPTQTGNTCSLPKHQISYFHVGCPPNRHIRVVKPQDVPCKMHTFEKYTIPGSVLRNPQKKDLLVDYDWKRFGCVLRIYYKSAFRPEINLYDGDKFVHSVDANFIVWERFGRKDYYFNATMSQVSCLHEAQTWESMLVDGKRPEEAWGPHNYRSCFVHAFGKEGNLNQPYEIMNRSSINYLTFSQKDSAIYIFIVRILDPHYSFCDLRTVFAVQTYGIKMHDQHISMYVVLILSFIIVIILCYGIYVTIDQFKLKKKT